jgi:pectinesterase
VALDVEGDQCVFKNCRIVGNQDTLYAAGDNTRQYFNNCHIEGTTDFIFGSSIAVFQDCDIVCKKQSFITAARTPQNQPFGYVFMNCKIEATPGIGQVYLGRPWRAYANVVFMNCELGGFIRPEGWSNWHDTDRYKTAFYAEYHNTGAGADTTQRVSWSLQLTDKQAQKYTVENILGVNNWKLK